MNILYSSDNNYAQHMGVSIYSLLVHNTDINQITIYIIDNDISNENCEKLYNLVSGFKNANLIFVPFSEWKSKLKLNMSWNISISSYARLFVSDMLPPDTDRVLYVDCDMIICKSLINLWNTCIEGKVLAAVQDSVNPDTKQAIGVDSVTPYFNAGLLLINLKEWRKQDIGEKCLAFIEEHCGNVRHHDQGVLNGILRGDFVKLPVSENLMTIHYFFSQRRTLSYFHEQAPFYSQNEIDSAKNDPTVLHYTPSFTSRPWVKGCKHPLKNLYWSNLNKTSWKSAKPQKNDEKWYVRIINWRYRVLK